MLSAVSKFVCKASQQHGVRYWYSDTDFIHGQWTNAMETSCWKTCRQHKHRNVSVISSLRKFCQTSKNQQSGETDGEKQSADGNAEKWYTNWVATKASISLASLRRCKKKLMTCSICIQQKKTNAMTSYPLNHYPHPQAVNYLDLLPLYGKSVIIELLKCQDPGYLVVKKCWPISKYWWPLFRILMGHWPILTKF